MKRLIIILAVILSGIEGSFSQQQKYSRVKIFTDSKGLQELSKAGVCIDHGDHKKNIFFISDFSEQELNIIKQSGFKYEIQIDDVQKYYRDQNDPSSSKYVPAPSPLTHGCNTVISYPTPSNFNLGSMAGFFTYNEIIAHLNNMATLFPTLIKAKASLDSLTIEGRPVYWLKISDIPMLMKSNPRCFIHPFITPANRLRFPNLLCTCIISWRITAPMPK